MRQILILFFIVISSSSLFARNNQYLQITAESGFYVSGQTVNLRVLCRDIFSNEIFDEKVLLMLDLVGPSGGVLEQKRIIIDYDHHEAQFTLPFDLESGIYRVYAYAEEEGIKPGHISINIFGNDYVLNSETSSKLNIGFEANTGIDKLVLNEVNEVITNVSDFRNNGVSLVGKLLDESDSTIMDIKTDSTGMARFTFVPQKKNHKLRFSNNDRIEEIELPEATQRAAIIEILENQSQYEIDFKTSPVTLSRVTLEEYYNDSLVSALRLDLGEKVKIYRPQPPGSFNGNVTYRLIDDSGVVISRKSINKARVEASFNIDVREYYEKQQQVEVSLTTTGLQAKGNSLLLVKVYDKQLSAEPKTGDMVTELERNPVSVSIDPISEDHSTRVSLFYVDEGKIDEMYYQQEELIKELKVKEGNSKVWAYQFDSQGGRLGEVKVNFKSDSVHYSVEKDSMAYLNKGHDIKIVHARKRVIIQSVYNSKHEEKHEKKFVNPDYSIRLSDYEALPTVEEVLKAFVPKCRLVKNGGEFVLRLVPKESSYKYKESPLIIINGIPTFDSKYIFDLDVKAIEVINLINSSRSQGNYGTFGINGIISFELKDGAINPLEAQYNVLPVIKDIDYPVQPNRTAIESNGPDLRDVLYWETNLRTNISGEAHFEFYTSEVSGEYVIYIEAITPEGETYHAHKEFSVK